MQAGNLQDSQVAPVRQTTASRKAVGLDFDPATCNLRQCPDVPEPAWNKPTQEQFFVRGRDGQDVPNVAFLKEHFFKEGRLEESQVVFILKETTKLLRQNNNLLHLPGPIVVCGDIHGQYYDLLRLFEVGGDPAETTYLFLGDYVDRGYFGIECLLYLYTLKLCYPDRIYLLRGNHECRSLTEFFTFRTECIRKYSSVVYEEAVESFRALPLAALIDNRFLCLHGGISPEMTAIQDIDAVDRFVEPPSHGLLCDILWADPATTFGHESNPGLHSLGPGTAFVHNPTRGCSYYFTYTATCDFLTRNNILGLIRGHEAQAAGYQMYRMTSKNIPSIITVFSAPNYCDQYNNQGAVLKYANGSITISQFKHRSHPYWLPNFLDAFTWSLPFMADKMANMLLGILACCTAEELEESPFRADGAIQEEAQTRTVYARRNEIRYKILAVGKVQRSIKTFRERAETAPEFRVGDGASSMEIDTAHCSEMQFS